MRFIAVLSMTLVLGFVGMTTASAQKKVQKFTVSKVMSHPASEVWSVVGEDYGAIANSHPRVIKSEYINGSLEAGEGAQRICYFNDKGNQYLMEKMVDYDPANMTFVNTVFRAGKFPVDPEYTKATYRVEPIDDNSSRFVFDMQYRTKPGFMGGLVKGKFKRLIDDYAIAIDHHLSTGESVTKENFKSVKKQHKAVTAP